MSDNIKLSEMQESVASYGEGALLVMAGAGSGKTRVLTERIKRLSGTTKKRVLAITYTNAASKEIVERLESDIDVNEKLFAGTFHAFSISVLESHGSNIGLVELPQIFSNMDDRISVLVAAINSVPNVKSMYSEKDEKQKSRFRYDVLDLFSGIKRNVIFEEDLECEGYDNNTILLYSAYMRTMKSLNAIDFDDLLLLTYRLFVSYPQIANLYRRSFEYICVDEAQDLNKAQYMLLRALMGSDYKNIMLVGDPNQSIYAFNGSSSKYMMESFVQDFEPKQIKLIENYRSSKKVLELANKIMPNSTEMTNIVVEGGCDIHSFESDKSESEWVVRKIKELLSNNTLSDIEGDINVNNISILARNRYLFNDIRSLLEESNIRCYFKNTSSDVDFNSESMDILQLALQVKINPFDRLHLSHLEKKLGIRNVKVLSDILLHSDIFDYHLDIISSVQRLSIDGSNFKKTIAEIKNKFENVSNYILNENERAYFLFDCNTLLSHWHIYNRNTTNPSLSAFRNAMSLGQTSQLTIPDGIALSTVHTMKGQENDIVFLIGMDQGTFPDYRATTAVELEQEKNNLYVAITRARRYIYITYPLSRMMPWGDVNLRYKSKLLPDVYI